MAGGVILDIDRQTRIPLATQIYQALRAGIEEGTIAPGARLPSWNDLAAQLGVARGTVRVAYERLIDEQYAIGMGAAGTRVARRPASNRVEAWSPEAPPMPELFHDFGTAPLSFQMGVPSQAAFPFMLWSRLMVRGARAAAVAPVSYPDPRGEPLLRAEIAAYLAIARGIQCSPSQILITAGFAGALGLAARALGLEGGKVWMEHPGFPLTRSALALSGLDVVGVPVDDEGLQVACGIAIAPDAALAVVTPGQQAPLGFTMSLPRRLALLAWAKQNGAWIIEDDYLSELQLKGRAAPALASLDRHGRVVHAGSFSKTISPALRLGFLVVPPALVRSFGDVAACLAPAPAAPVQRAVAEFLREGHYFRHLRRMKRLYHAQREAITHCLSDVAADRLTVGAHAGLAVIASLPPDAPDVDIALKALAYGLAPAPLSPWYGGDSARRGLLLGVTNIALKNLEADCRRLAELAR